MSLQSIYERICHAMTLRTPPAHHHTITISYRLSGIGITKSYSMIDKRGRGRGMYDITDVPRGLGDAVKRIAVGVGGYYPHPPLQICSTWNILLLHYI